MVLPEFVLLIFFSRSGGGTSMERIEFKTERACMVAEQKIRSRSYNSPGHIDAVCISYGFSMKPEK